MAKYRARVTIEFEVTVPGRLGVYDPDEVEQEILTITEDAAVTLYDNLHNNARTGHPRVDVELKPKEEKRTSKRRR